MSHSQLTADSEALHEHFVYVSAYDDATFVQKALPLANRFVTPEESVEAFLLTRSWRHRELGFNMPQDTDDLASAQDEATTSVLGALVGSEELVSTEGELVKQARAFRRTSVQLRKDFRHAVCLIANDQNGTTEEIRGFIDAALEDVKLYSTLTWTGKKQHIETKYCPISDKAFVGLVLMMILDEKGKLYNHLRICKLDTCDNFFLSLPGPHGGGQQLYCKDDHRKDAVRQTGADRTALWRKNKAKKGQKQRSQKR